MVMVVNVRGSGDDDPSCSCDDWIEHWRENTTSGTGTKCSNIACGGTRNIVGGHVKKVGSSIVYIAPLCKDCNHSSNIDQMDIGNTCLVDPDECDS